jgi:allantoinase
MIIHNGQVALPGADRFQRLDIRVQEGKIVELGASAETGLRAGDEPTIDAAGLLVLPGGIDAHVHFDDPGYTEREDFYHGSCAAASGGITTVVDMPCTSVPPVTSMAHLREKLAAVEGKAAIDFGLYGGVSAQSFAESLERHLAELAPHVLGFKAYFISGMEAFGRLDHYRFHRLLRRAAGLGRPVLLHAEDYDYVTAATEAARREGDRPRHYVRSRPEMAEILAVQAAVRLAEDAGADLHIVHVGTAEAAEIVAASAGRVTCETAPHYLAFDLDDFERIGAPLKVTPPVKGARDGARAPNRERLWALLSGGQIDWVASDHAPCPAEEKASGSIWTAYSGLPGTGTLLPYLYAEGYQRGRLSLRRLLEVSAESAARRYGIDDRKGFIAVGHDADFAFIDPGGEWTVRGAAFYSKGKVTPFEGMTLPGRVVRTIVRGTTVYDAERGIVAPAGYGAWLRPRQTHSRGDL